MSCKCRKCRKRPNVILILVDDMAKASIGTEGNPFIQEVLLPGETTKGGTKNIDKLYNESVRLNDFHVAPVCTPTRSALLTGRYPIRNGGMSVLGPKEPIFKDEVLMSEIFKANGYKTHLSGKWHVGSTPGYLPNDRGFDETLYNIGGASTSTSEGTEFDYIYKTLLYRNGNEESFLGDLDGNGFVTEHIFNDSIKFIEKYATKDKPFFSYIATLAPHSPYRCPPSYRDVYKAVGVRGYDELHEIFTNNNTPGSNAEYYGMISLIDKQIGILRNKLDELNIADDTLLVFITDNGKPGELRDDAVNRCEELPFFEDYTGGLRGLKGEPYEGGHRAASYWYYPNGNIQGGKSLNDLSAHIDFLPTVMDVCNLKSKCLKLKPLDGISLKNILTGVSSKPDRKLVVEVVSTLPPTVIQPSDSCIMQTTKEHNWRLISPGTSGFVELYDLNTDLGEENNIIDDHPDVVANLTNFWDNYYADVTSAYDPNDLFSFTNVQLGHSKKTVPLFPSYKLFPRPPFRHSWVMFQFGLIPEHTNKLGASQEEIDEDPTLSKYKAFTLEIRNFRRRWANNNVSCLWRDQFSGFGRSLSAPVNIVNTGLYKFRMRRFKEDRTVTDIKENPGQDSPDYFNYLLPYNENTPLGFRDVYSAAKVEIVSEDGKQTQTFIQPIITGSTDVILYAEIYIKGKVLLKSMFLREGIDPSTGEPYVDPDTGRPLMPLNATYTYITYKGNLPKKCRCKKCHKEKTCH